MISSLFLASNSPRRREILENLGFNIKILSIEIDETPHPAESAHQYVLRMAQEKNRAAIAQYGSSDTPILTADTTVALNGHILGKPESIASARAMLSTLSGSVHQVLTSVCVSRNGQEWLTVQSNDVQFKPLSPDEIDRYIATGEPMDKAGAYGIQGIGGAFVAHLSGSFTGVMGLPVFETLALLRDSGMATPPFAPQD